MFIVKDFLHWLSRRRLKLLVLLAAAVWGAVWVWPPPDLRVVFCSVGQGDASIASRGFTQVLIDAGPASSRRSSQTEGGPVTDCLARHLPFFDHRLEAVIISHPQVDHFGGLPAVLNRYQVDKFIFNGIAGDSKSWADLSRLIEEENSQVITLAEGSKLKIGEIEIDVLWPEKSCELWVMGCGSGVSHESESPQLTTHNSQQVLGAASSRDLNADGLVLGLSYGDFSALFTGDVRGMEEKKIIENNLTIQQFNNFDILKVPHHGSKTSSSSEFLEAVRPALAVIEVGKNSYGHPADEVLKRLNAVGAKVLRTDRDGDVVVRTDGEKWWIDK